MPLVINNQYFLINLIIEYFEVVKFNYYQLKSLIVVLTLIFVSLSPQSIKYFFKFNNYFFLILVTYFLKNSPYSYFYDFYWIY